MEIIRSLFNGPLGTILSKEGFLALFDGPASIVGAIVLAVIGMALCYWLSKYLALGIRFLGALFGALVGLTIYITVFTPVGHQVVDQVRLLIK